MGYEELVRRRPYVRPERIDERPQWIAAREGVTEAMDRPELDHDVPLRIVEALDRMGILVLKPHRAARTRKRAGWWDARIPRTGLRFLIE